MSTSEADAAVGGSADANAELEMALIQQYLARHRRNLDVLSPEQAERLRKEAVLYAALQMEMVKARANLLGSLHNPAVGM